MPTVPLSLDEGDGQVGRNVEQLETLTPPTWEKKHTCGLTLEEHGEAEVLAYYCAERRGGGRLPPYDYVEAVEDFCWAAEVVLSRRPGVRPA